MREAKEPAPARGRQMAYEHTISVETDEAGVAVAHEAAQAACKAAVDEACEILDASITRGKSSRADLRFRVKPAGVEKLKAAVSGSGTLVSQHTRAEDLSGPVADSAKRLSMLKDYQVNLESLRKQAGKDVDALIKVHRELAETQSEIEALVGEQARLTQRVETEILSIHIGSAIESSFWAKIARSLSEFGTNLSSGVASVITGLAYLIPWGCVLLFLVWGVRRLWLRRRR